MNLTEFAALKEGDTVDNPFAHSRGTVVEVTKDGVRVRWGDIIEGPTFKYTPLMQAWTHWQLPEGQQHET